MSVVLAVHVEDGDGRRFPAGSIRFYLSDQWEVRSDDAIRWRNDTGEDVTIVGVAGGMFFWGFEPTTIRPRGDVIIRDLSVSIGGNLDSVERLRGMYMRDEIDLAEFVAAVDRP